MKITAKQITTTAVLLAICIVFQFFKNLSVFITGPIVNACILLAVVSCGPVCGVILSVITPITAFLITGAPVMKMFPVIMPLIMCGNAILALVFWAFDRKKQNNVFFIVGGVVGAAAKALFMGLTISLGVLGTATLPEKMAPMLPKLQMTYSVIQLATALIGLVYAFIIWIPLKKAFYSTEPAKQ